MEYRRSDVKGATYFLTINLTDRTSDLLIREINLLRDAFRKTKISYPFNITAMVVMPDHMHILMELPENDNDYPLRIRLIKTHFSKNIPKKEQINTSRLSKSERGIWQRRYWKHQIKDEKDMNSHIDYIHFNPVKHGYVASPIDWKFSSIHKFIKLEMLPENWGCGVVFIEDREFGE